VPMTLFRFGLVLVAIGVTWLAFVWFLAWRLF